MGGQERAQERRLAALVRGHARWRGRQCLNLLPSENSLSPKALSYLATDFAGRYTLPMKAMVDGELLENSYAGTRYTDAIESLASQAAQRVFRGRYATVRPLSGHIAAMAVLSSLLPRGSSYLSIPPEAGGYDGYDPGYLPALLGYRAVPLPCHGPTHQLDLEGLTATLRTERPQAVILGQSFILFPYPLREVAEAAHAVDALVIYDGSHVMGLIAGGQFQDPLTEGADVLLGSTHKSFFGPQGGIVVTNREDLFAQIDGAMTWRVQDNAHWNRIAALAQSLLEMERVGAAYARTVIRNSQALARALDEEGIPLVGQEEGYTRSHQIWIDKVELRERFQMGAVRFARNLESQDIIVDLVGRVGTAEVSRWGMTPSQMPAIARWIREAGLQHRTVRAQVHRFRSKYPRLRFI
jgi:glycine hydroxymethyltransferase